MRRYTPSFSLNISNGTTRTRLLSHCCAVSPCQRRQTTLLQPILRNFHRSPLSKRKFGNSLLPQTFLRVYNTSEQTCLQGFASELQNENKRFAIAKQQRQLQANAQAFAFVRRYYILTAKNWQALNQSLSKKRANTSDIA